MMHSYLVSYAFVKKEYSDILKHDIDKSGFGHTVIAYKKLDNLFIDKVVSVIKEQNNFEDVVILNIVKLCKSNH